MDNEKRKKVKEITVGIMNANNGNWADKLDYALEESGFELGEKPDGSDSSHLATIVVDGEEYGIFNAEGYHPSNILGYRVVSMNEIDNIWAWAGA